MLYTQHTQFLLNRQRNNAKEDEEKMQPNGEKSLLTLVFFFFP